MAALSAMFKLKQRLLLCIILDYGSLITVIQILSGIPR